MKQPSVVIAAVLLLNSTVGFRCLADTEALDEPATIETTATAGVPLHDDEEQTGEAQQKFLPAVVVAIGALIVGAIAAGATLASQLRKPAAPECAARSHDH